MSLQTNRSHALKYIHCVLWAIHSQLNVWIAFPVDGALLALLMKLFDYNIFIFIASHCKRLLGQYVSNSENEENNFQKSQ